MGHSMGSFIARCYIAKYGVELQGSIILGTAGPNPLIDTGINLANSFILAKGKMYRSRKINEISCGVFNEQFKPIKTKYDWTTSDLELCRKYLKDETRNFIFTASGFKDLFLLHKTCNSAECFLNTPKDLPIILISGSCDPVGNNAIGVAKVYQYYYIAGCKNIDMRIYLGMRHEVLNDIGKENVFNDIKKFLDKVLKRII